MPKTQIPRPSARNKNVLLALCLLSIVFFSCKKDKTEECGNGVPPTGHMVFKSATNSYEYTTSGGATITITLPANIVIRHPDIPTFKIEFWGDIELADGETGFSGDHENLNGKHIKDRFGPTRTLVFPDGAKLTIVTDGGDKGLITSVTIYDGAECHRINPDCYILTHSFSNLAESQKMDNAEADGETATFEFTTTGLIFVNIYNEATPGNKVHQRNVLGEIFTDDIHRVMDYFDDPRLGHT